MTDDPRKPKAIGRSKLVLEHLKKYPIGGLSASDFCKSESEETTSEKLETNSNLSTAEKSAPEQPGSSQGGARESLPSTSKGRGQLKYLFTKQPDEQEFALKVSRKSEKPAEKKGRGRGYAYLNIYSRTSEESPRKEVQKDETKYYPREYRDEDYDEKIWKGRESSIKLSKKSSKSEFESDDDFDIEALKTGLEEINEGGEHSVRRGETGNKMSLYCNYVMLFTDPGSGVFEFLVKFEPEVDYVAFRYQLIYNHFQKKRGIKCYDGDSKLFMPELITPNKLIVAEKHPKDSSPVTITITFKKKLKPKECSHLYNVLFNCISKEMNLTRLGKHFFDHRLAIQIPQYKLEVWPGYVYSVEEFDGGIMLCCDIRHRVLRTQTALNVLSNIAIMSPENFKTISLKELLGQYVLTRYNNNTYKIDDIDWDKNPESTFKLRDGEEVTFLEYYKVHYDLQIRDLKQPLLISKLKKMKNDNGPKQIYLIPELCHITGLSDSMKKDMKVMKDIAMYTQVTPAQRNYGFMKFLTNIKNDEKAQEILNEWGLKIVDDPLKIECRAFLREKLQFKDGLVELAPENMEWSRFLRQYGVFRSTHIKHWILIHTFRDRHCAESLRKTLQGVGPGLGIQIDEPLMVTIKDDKTDSYINSLRDNATPKTQLCVILCPTRREDRYIAIKKFCFLEIRTHSQVINCGTISRESKMLTIVQNIALQINNKLGGASWAVKIPLKNTMICGIDSYHDGAGKRPSVAAFVASIDSEFTRWFSKSCIQNPNQELVDGLVNNFICAIKKYLEENFTVPERIIIYRDGVGDGQLPLVQDYEFEQLKKACSSLPFEFKPKFTFIVVQKRTNTKLFLERDLSSNSNLNLSSRGCQKPPHEFQKRTSFSSEKQPYGSSKGGAIRNAPPGTVIDHTITRKYLYDFYLVSQFVSVSTARPSHYIVIFDSGNFKPDIIQQLTYKLCYLYYNWAGSIRVPAPCQYAHKLAYMVGENIRAYPPDTFNSFLYYL